MRIDIPFSALPAAVPRPEAVDFHRPVYCLFGLAFDLVDMPGATGRLSKAFRERTRLVLATPNVNHVCQSQTDFAYRDAINRCDLVVADGMPLVWIARLLGVRAHRVAGASLFEELMKGAAGPVRAFFFGGTDSVGRAACETLNRDRGALSGAGWHCPGFGELKTMISPEVLAEINAAEPDFVVVALGAAKGHAWIESAGPHLSAPVLSHLGAVVNFVAGTLKRAPESLQRIGFEWLWRIKEEPALWRRYARDALTLAGLIRRSVLPLLASRLRQALWPLRSTAGLNTVTTAQGTRRLLITGHWQTRDVVRLRQALAALTMTDGPIEIDAAGLGNVDAQMVALLIRLYGHQLRVGAGWVIVNAGVEFARLLRWHCASYLLAGRGA